MTKPCACCGSTLIGNAVGVQWNRDNTRIVAAVCQCIPPCNNTRYIPWATVDEKKRHEAALAERVRMAMEGAV